MLFINRNNFAQGDQKKTIKKTTNKRKASTNPNNKTTTVRKSVIDIDISTTNENGDDEDEEYELFSQETNNAYSYQLMERKQIQPNHQQVNEKSNKKNSSTCNLI